MDYGFLSRVASTIRAVRSDGWQNFITGLGTSRDKTTFASFASNFRLTDQELRALFHHHDIARRIVSIRPNEAFREGVNVQVNGEGNPALDDTLKNLEVVRLFREGAIWGRLYGGCLLVAGLDDGQPMDQPLDPERPIRAIRYLLLLDKRWVFPATYYEDPEMPKYGQVETYQLTTPNGRTLGASVHETRVVRFGGALTDEEERRANNGWDHSILQAVYDALRDAETNWKSATNLLSDASQAVFKIKGLINILATPSGESTLRTRMELVDMARSVARAIILDSDGEEFSRVSTTFTGVPDLLDRSMMRTASAAEVPVTILFGRSAAGMNATGDSDFRSFYDTIRSYQVQDLEPLYRKVVDWILRSQGVTGSEIKVEWPRLWQPTEAEQADIDKTEAETAKIYIDSGVWLAEEKALALSRGGPVEIDESFREMMLANEKDLASETPPSDAPSPPVRNVGTPDEALGTQPATEVSEHNSETD